MTLKEFIYNHPNCDNPRHLIGLLSAHLGISMSQMYRIARMDKMPMKWRAKIGKLTHGMVTKFDYREIH